MLLALVGMCRSGQRGQMSNAVAALGALAQLPEWVAAMSQGELRLNAALIRVVNFRRLDLHPTSPYSA